MTFRDKSADVTLNNANEEIMRTKYARSDPRNPDPKGDFARRARLEAEIDALKEELAIRCNSEARAWSKIDELKAENERLKADAELLHKVVKPVLDYWYEDGESKTHEDHLNAFRELSLVYHKSTAIKDFSTTTKEEGEKA